MTRTIRIQTEPFDPTSEIKKLTESKGQIGAVASFVGLVRNTADQTLVSMTLEHYPAMAIQELQSIASKAEEKWPLEGLTIIHRYGTLNVGEEIVLVAVASAHREAAFAATSYIMDYLKMDAPFWKKEKTHIGEAWVSVNQKDQQALRSWQKKDQ